MPETGCLVFFLFGFAHAATNEAGCQVFLLFGVRSQRFHGLGAGKAEVSRQSDEEGSGEMTDFNKISKQAADVAERVADVADAARGKGPRKSGGGGWWLLLPAAGAAVYAVAKRGSDVPRRAKDLVGQVKGRASELPDLDLLGRVREVTGLADDGQEAGQAGEESAGRSSRSAGLDDLERNRRERAERREKRRERISA